jgi:hypothetical protein
MTILGDCFEGKAPVPAPNSGQQGQIAQFISISDSLAKDRKFFLASDALELEAGMLHFERFSP